jgi:glycine/D-amino acid oxidase-like deaminating enzyme
MDLTSGDLFWPRQTTPPNYPRLETSLACDVAIIGGGITGALVAHYLSEAGFETVVIEKRSVGRGSTGASTALLQYEIDTHLVDLKRKVGEDNAVRAYQLCLEAINKLETLTHSLGDPCGFECKRSLYLASRPGDVKMLYEEYEARRQMGIELKFLEGATLESDFSLPYPAALLSSVAAQVDPFALAHGLLSRAMSKGLRVFENTEIESFENDELKKTSFLKSLSQPDPITLTTTTGITITARSVVFATGYESQQYLAQPVVKLHSSYALVSERLELGWASDYLIWETARPYLYLRTTADGRVLVGGEDVPFQNPKARDALLKRKTKVLQERFTELFPERPLEVAYAWTGTFGETKDGLPFIGKTPEYPNAYFALGYGGNGITYSLIAAELIRDGLLGKNNPDAMIFRFKR